MSTDKKWPDLAVMSFSSNHKRAWNSSPGFSQNMLEMFVIQHTSI